MGRRTRDAISAFQSAFGLERTAEADAPTCLALFSPPPEPDPDLRAAQHGLAVYGVFFGEIDGLPGPKTDEALASFRRLTGRTDLPTGAALAALVAAENTARTRRIRDWIETGGEDPDEKLANLDGEAKKAGAQAAFASVVLTIPTDLPSHIAYRDENGDLKRRGAQIPEGDIPEPSIFTGTAPYELIVFYTNFSGDADWCSEAGGHDVFSDRHFYIQSLKESYPLWDKESYLTSYELHPSKVATTVNLDDKPDIWCLQSAEFGLQFADPGTVIPAAALERLAANRAEEVESERQAAAEAEREDLIVSETARIAQITDPAALEAEIDRALEPGGPGDEIASIALAALENALRARGPEAHAATGDPCSLQLADFSAYVLNTGDGDLPIFATLRPLDHRTHAFVVAGEHRADITGYMRPAFIEGMLMTMGGKGERVDFLQPQGTRLEELLDTGSGPFLDGAVLRIDGEMTIAPPYVLEGQVFPSAHFVNLGDRWHRLTFIAGTQTGLTYLRGRGEVTISDATVSLGGPDCAVQ